MNLKPVSRRSNLRLGDRDARPLSKPDKADLRDELDELNERLRDLQRVFYADGRFALLVVLQGRDTSGKDGVIRHVFGGVNPQGCQVTSFGVPTSLELKHDFLWRVHQHVPGRGMIGIFNRSHYEDVLVVRVKNLAPKAVWQARYDQINAFERMLTENRVVVLKFFLHISRDEQKKRFIERIEDPTKTWKFRAGDLDDRKLWPAYTAAYRDALRKCSTSWAPWYVVPGDHERARDLLIARAVVKTLEGLKLRYPPADPGVRTIKVR
jgi:PPK2 family polyphosphate:nucleotide phosphotransferase